jgi:hypothetical protein
VTPTQNKTFFHLNPLFFLAYSKSTTQNPKTLTVRPDRSKNFERKKNSSLSLLRLLPSFFLFFVCVVLNGFGFGS